MSAATAHKVTFMREVNATVKTFRFRTICRRKQRLASTFGFCDR
jgi:hypothetical protein